VRNSQQHEQHSLFQRGHIILDRAVIGDGSRLTFLIFVEYYMLFFGYDTNAMDSNVAQQ
jgi:hypothetical protein